MLPPILLIDYCPVRVHRYHYCFLEVTLPNLFSVYASEFLIWYVRPPLSQIRLVSRVNMFYSDDWEVSCTGLGITPISSISSFVNPQVVFSHSSSLAFLTEEIQGPLIKNPSLTVKVCYDLRWCLDMQSSRIKTELPFSQAILGIYFLASTSVK